MVTLLFGQTIIFWSGVLAGVSFIILMVTCSFNLGCMGGICNEEKRKKLFGLHKYFVWSSIILVAIHAILALLAYILGIWL